MVPDGVGKLIFTPSNAAKRKAAGNASGTASTPAKNGRQAKKAKVEEEETTDGEGHTAEGGKKKGKEMDKEVTGEDVFADAEKEQFA